MNSWYTIRARATGAEVLIYDEIGAYGVSAKGFLAELGALPDDAPIDLRLNSPGAVKAISSFTLEYLTNPLIKTVYLDLANFYFNNERYSYAYKWFLKVKEADVPVKSPCLVWASVADFSIFFMVPRLRDFQMLMTTRTSVNQQ